MAPSGRRHRYERRGAEDRRLPAPIPKVLLCLRGLNAVTCEKPAVESVERVCRTAERLEALAERLLDTRSPIAGMHELRVRRDELLEGLADFAGSILAVVLHARTDALLRPRLPAARGVRPTGEDRRWLERVRRELEAGISQESFSVEVLASRLAVHRSGLHRRLHHLTGLPPVQLILRWRLARSAALLASGDLSVSQAAYAVGFQSVEHFSRSFRKHYGLAPSAYRKAVAESAATAGQPTKDQGPATIDHSALRSSRVL